MERKQKSMGLFTRMKEPVFLKENSTLGERLEKLKALEPSLNEEGKIKLRQDIRCLEAGIFGEKNIAFELKNSHMPMYVIHDLYLRDGELTSQIDYLVITRKLRFVIECKNLYGDIEIDSQGTFVRTMRFGRQEKREGIYSPITQNQHHMALLKKLRLQQAGGIIKRLFYDRQFEENHRSVVVLSNPRTVLNARYAREEVRSQVIRADQLIDYIREACEESRNKELSDKEMKELAYSYLDMEQENETDYLEKYSVYIQRDIRTEAGEKAWARGAGEQREQGQDQKLDPDMERLVGELKAFRWNTSQAEGIKPYFIFNNNQMMDLIRRYPETLEQLKAVSGFSDMKVQKYGQEILAILDKYRYDRRKAAPWRTSF